MTTFKRHNLWVYLPELLFIFFGFIDLFQRAKSLRQVKYKSKQSTSSKSAIMPKCLLTSCHLPLSFNSFPGEEKGSYFIYYILYICSVICNFCGHINFSPSISRILNPCSSSMDMIIWKYFIWHKRGEAALSWAASEKTGPSWSGRSERPLGALMLLAWGASQGTASSVRISNTLSTLCLGLAFCLFAFSLDLI